VSATMYDSGRINENSGYGQYSSARMMALLQDGYTKTGGLVALLGWAARDGGFADGQQAFASLLRQSCSLLQVDVECWTQRYCRRNKIVRTGLQPPANAGLNVIPKAGQLQKLADHLPAIHGEPDLNDCGQFSRGLSRAAIDGWR
jgi:hypothetical protein